MTPSPSLAAALPTGNDFGDWLSPILVKELRQGLKSRAFVAIFIIVQVIMLLLVGMELLTLANGAVRGTTSFFGGLFWTMVYVSLILFMPARGLIAVSEEVRANTLDLVQLTRLTAFRIVFGKWVALISQTVLLVTAILPYAVLRYFFGNVDIVGDLQYIGSALLASMLFTAGAIALSTVHLAVRIVVLLIGIPVSLIIVITYGFFEAMGGSTIMGGWDPSWIWVFPTLAALYSYLLLEVAASKIAPDAENHAAPKRLLALLMAVVGVVLTLFASDDLAAGWISLCIPAWIWVMIEALSERTITVPSLYFTFASRGLLGRIAGRLLYPGWATALLFCVVLLALSWLVFWAFNKSLMDWSENLSAMALVSPILFTAIITPVMFLLVFPRVKQPIWLYILVQAIFALLFVIAYVGSQAPQLSAADTYRWLAPLPPSALLAILAESDNQELQRVFTFVTIPVCGLVIAYLTMRALQEFRVIARLERESLGQKPVEEKPVSQP